MLRGAVRTAELLYAKCGEQRLAYNECDGRMGCAAIFTVIRLFRVARLSIRLAQPEMCGWVVGGAPREEAHLRLTSWA